MCRWEQLCYRTGLSKQSAHLESLRQRAFKRLQVALHLPLNARNVFIQTDRSSSTSTQSRGYRPKNGVPQRLQAVGKNMSGGWPSLCMDWDPVREAAQKFLLELANVVSKHSSMYAYDVWNEPQLEPAGGREFNASTDQKLYCYCDKTIASFQNWLKRRYGTLEKLSEAWVRRYPSWEVIDPPLGRRVASMATCRFCVQVDLICNTGRLVGSYRVRWERSEPVARVCLGGPRQRLRVDILPDALHFAVLKCDVEDPVVLEGFTRCFDLPRGDADGQNSISLRHEFRRLWVSHFHLFGCLPKRSRQSCMPAVRTGQGPVLTRNDPLNIFCNQRKHTLLIATARRCCV